MRNVVVICLDTVREDFFEHYASEIQDLADVSYDECRAASAWSVPSHASMLTGSLPHQHGVHAHNMDFSTLPNDAVITTRLPDHTTLSVSANRFTTEEFGFDTWFQDCISVTPDRVFPEGLDARQSTGVFDHLRRSATHSHPFQSFANGIAVEGIKLIDQLPIPTLFDDGARAIVNQTLGRIESIEEPYFLFTNFMEAHAPHRDAIFHDRSISNVPNGWHTAKFDHWNIMEQDQRANAGNESEIEWFRGLYAAAVLYLDTIVASFVRELQVRSHWETTIIITADHGENLGYASEDYQFVHTASLSEGLLHVPFIVINPPTSLRSEAEPSLWSHLDLPEIIEYFATGRGGIPFTERRYVPAEIVGSTFGANGPEGEFWRRAIRCAYDADLGTKYVWDSLENKNIYDIETDRPSWQKLSESSELEGEIAELELCLFDNDIEQHKTEISGKKGVSPEQVSKSTQKRLEKLGYL